MRKMRVAIIGQGRSGRDIHGGFFLSDANDKVEVVCIVEKSASRREKAKREFGCDVVADYTELFDRNDIDVVVNASFSQLHYPIAKDLLAHGFNVLNEKPFARTTYECMDLINTAKSHGCTVTAFHQTLMTPVFQKVKQVIASGKLGRILQINLKYSGFSRRWDWQTLQSFCGGSVYNSGPHPIGQALDLLDWDDKTQVIFSKLDTVQTSGDAEDYAKILLSAPGKPVVDIEINCADAFAGDFTFKIFGSDGTYISDNSNYKLKYVERDKLPQRPLIRHSLSNEQGSPAYCAEKLDIHEETGTIQGTSFYEAVKNFYDSLYATVMLGKAPAVSPEMAMQVINVIETCHAQNPLPVKFDDRVEYTD